jgi:hypothetical protein
MVPLSSPPPTILMRSMKRRFPGNAGFIAVEKVLPV